MWMLLKFIEASLRLLALQRTVRGRALRRHPGHPGRAANGSSQQPIYLQGDTTSRTLA